MEDENPVGLYDSRNDLSGGAPVVDTVAKQVYANAHAYHINSISVNSDQETFLTSDDLRINVWHLNCTNQSFNIVDIKPTNMEDLTEVITAAEFHPKHCALFVYSSSKGVVRLCDMRQNALCDRHALLFDEPDDPVNRSFFSEIINSISDVKISSSGNYMLSRDYLSLKVWDVRMSKSGPVECYPVHEYLRSRLCALYENDCIFDKFECCWSPDDRYVMTGSYNSFFRVFDRVNHTDVTLEASRETMRHIEQPLMHRKVVPNMGGLSACQPSSVNGIQMRRRGEITADTLDYSRKVLHLHWDPVDNTVAVSTSNNLFILVGEDGSSSGDKADNTDNHASGQSLSSLVDQVGDNS
jgi:serine/threonine-protein phosphatase 2A regulatory subunit B